MERTHCGNLLLVEDDADQRECMIDELERAGYHVASAGDGREALEVLAAIDRPCLILLDLMMPEMTGFEFMTRLNKLDDPAPVVITSAYVEEGKVPAGALDVLPKPFTIRALLNVVERHC